ncbi:hypothetical protein C8F04DRAFT_1254859 [Mycena alexandri]|uniref:GS catalytic domain-containing protein n=1 Tax=Mycena alexandri TaxID=1745969 RepID=A0AAD6T525_9AGAR|nr:hypothetical protein C8F04DRAFT_1254859 [Mycena alexandri]
MESFIRPRAYVQGRKWDMRDLDTVSYVRIYWVDLVNVHRCRIVPVQYFKALMKSNRPGVVVAKASLGLVYLTVPCPFAPGHMAILGQFEEKTAIPDDTGSLSLKPVHIHDFAASTGLLAGAAQSNALEEIADAITASGIVLEMYHAEAAPGQYEVVTGPLTPLEAADALIHTREIIVQVRARTRIFQVHAAGVEKTAEGLSKHEQAFLAGVLDHLPAIVALTLPTHASYKRVADGVWSGGTYVCWGTENRESSLRLTNATSPGSRNFEARFIDGTANPHLALAAVFAGAFIGLKSMMELEVLDCSGLKTAAELTEDERLALGIKKRLPLNIEDARKNLEQDSALCELLTRDFVESYLSVDRTLQAALSQDETEAQELTRLVKFY